MMKKRRSKRSSPYIIGLTGSIGMGKSTVARMFARLGVPMLDSDSVVHRLLGKNGKAVAKVAALFPETFSENQIDRQKLGREVFGNELKRKALEAILHPLVRKAQQDFIRQMKRKGMKRVLLDIPLLFETGAEVRCNKVIVVTAPPFMQKQRVLRRRNMTEEKFHRILSLQMPDRKKCAQADVIIQTGLGRAISLQQLRAFLKSMK